mgnify:CR=1 FL=1
MKTLKSGVRLKSAVCDTEVMVTKAAADEIQLTCGGAEMIEMSAAKTGGAPDAAHAAGTLVGKRYVDEAGTIELLCVKPGKGSLALDGTALVLKEAKPLPASD